MNYDNQTIQESNQENEENHTTALGADYLPQNSNLRNEQELEKSDQKTLKNQVYGGILIPQSLVPSTLSPRCPESASKSEKHPKPENLFFENSAQNKPSKSLIELTDKHQAANKRSPGGFEFTKSTKKKKHGLSILQKSVEFDVSDKENNANSSNLSGEGAPKNQFGHIHQNLETQFSDSNFNKSEQIYPKEDKGRVTGLNKSGLTSQPGQFDLSQYVIAEKENLGKSSLSRRTPRHSYHSKAALSSLKSPKYSNLIGNNSELDATSPDISGLFEGSKNTSGAIRAPSGLQEGALESEGQPESELNNIKVEDGSDDSPGHLQMFSFGITPQMRITSTKELGEDYRKHPDLKIRKFKEDDLKNQFKQANPKMLAKPVEIRQERQAVHQEAPMNLPEYTDSPEQPEIGEVLTDDNFKISQTSASIATKMHALEPQLSEYTNLRTSGKQQSTSQQNRQNHENEFSELSEKFSVVIRDHRGPSSAQKSATSTVRSREDLQITQFQNSNFGYSKLQESSDGLLRSNRDTKSMMVMASLDYSKSNLEETQKTAKNGNFGKKSEFVFEPNPEVERIKRMYLKKEDLIKIREEVIQQCQMELLRSQNSGVSSGHLMSTSHTASISANGRSLEGGVGSRGADFMLQKTQKIGKNEKIDFGEKSLKSGLNHDLEQEEQDERDRESFGTFQNHRPSLEKEDFADFQISNSGQNDHFKKSAISQETQFGSQTIDKALKQRYSVVSKNGSSDIDFTKTPNTSQISHHQAETGHNGHSYAHQKHQRSLEKPSNTQKINTTNIEKLGRKSEENFFKKCSSPSEVFGGRKASTSKSSISPKLLKKQQVNESLKKNLLLTIQQQQAKKGPPSILSTDPFMDITSPTNQKSSKKGENAEILKIGKNQLPERQTAKFQRISQQNESPSSFRVCSPKSLPKEPSNGQKMGAAHLVSFQPSELNSEQKKLIFSSSKKNSQMNELKDSPSTPLTAEKSQKITTDFGTQTDLYFFSDHRYAVEIDGKGFEEGFVGEDRPENWRNRAVEQDYDNDFQLRLRRKLAENEAQGSRRGSSGVSGTRFFDSSTQIIEEEEYDENGCLTSPPRNSPENSPRTGNPGLGMFKEVDTEPGNPKNLEENQQKNFENLDQIHTLNTDIEEDPRFFQSNSSQKSRSVSHSQSQSQKIQEFKKPTQTPPLAQNSSLKQLNRYNSSGTRTQQSQSHSNLHKISENAENPYNFDNLIPDRHNDTEDSRLLSQHSLGFRRFDSLKNLRIQPKNSNSQQTISYYNTNNNSFSRTGSVSQMSKALENIKEEIEAGVFAGPAHFESDFRNSFDRRETLSLPQCLKGCIAQIKPRFEDEMFSYIGKECFLYSFMCVELNDLGLEFIKTGIKVSVLCPFWWRERRIGSGFWCFESILF